MNAYRVSIGSETEYSCVVFAATHAKARWVAMRSMREAGFNIPWNGLRSSRAKDLDSRFKTGLENRALGEDYI
jgi:hypothetical protein